MPRPRSSSLQRAVRFNSLLLNGDSLEDIDLNEDGMRSEMDVPGRDDDEDTVRHTNNTEYIEFRKLIQSSSSSTRKMNNNSSNASRRASKTIVSSKTVADRRRRSSSLSSKDLMIITNSASSASGSKSSPSSKRKTSIENESAGERDDGPTTRQRDEEQEIERSQETPTGNAEAHFAFAIPDGDDIRVVCKAGPLISEDGTPLPVASTFGVKAGQSMPMPLHSTDVIVAVEASSISALDCVVRRGFDGRGPMAFDYTPGCDIVGTVVKCGQEAFLSGIGEGERVACISRYGGNARYIRLPADSLVKTHNDIDPSEAAGAILPYFLGFQILQSGISPPLRYKAPLRGKQILIAENTGIVGLAMASLCKVGGAKKTFVVCPLECHDQMKSLGAVPLSANVDDWARKIKEKVDILVGKVSGKVQQTFLKTSGSLVRLALPPVPPPPESKPSFVPGPIRNFYSVAHMAFVANRASLYDVLYSIEKNPALYKSDLTHILKLLALRRIRPKIDKFVLLSDVGECHQELEKFQQEGAIVCEPWRRGGIDNMIYQT